jgi:DNA repair exonuclease SbcCD ATPase subunit
MKPAERKSVLLRVLGIERLEQLAERAREHRREADAEARTLEARLADELARGGDLAALSAQLTHARETENCAHLELQMVQHDIASARENQSEAKTALDASTAREKRRLDISTELRDANARAANNRALLADADSVRGAVARVRELSGEVQRYSDRVAELQRQGTEAGAAIREAESSIAAAGRDKSATRAASSTRAVSSSRAASSTRAESISSVASASLSAERVRCSSNECSPKGSFGRVSMQSRQQRLVS